MSARQPLNIDALIVNDAAAMLAADNRAAQREKDERDWKELERIVKRFGFCNTVAGLAEIADKMGGEFPEEAIDYEHTREVLEASAAGVDLTYGAAPERAATTRIQALANMRRLMAGIQEA